MYISEQTALAVPFMVKKFAFINEKGGSGKTTSVVNVGAFLVKHGKKVLIVDLDPQGNASMYLGVDPEKLSTSIYNALISQVFIDEAKLNTQIQNLDLLPANQDLAGFEVEYAQEAQRFLRLNNILRQIEVRYDFVLIDPPPSLGILTLNALFASDGLVIPVQTEYFAQRALKQIFNVIDLLQKNQGKSFESINALLTMYDKRNLLARDVAKDIQRNFPGHVFKTIIPRNVRLAEAPRFGKTIFQYASDSKGAIAYENLAIEMIDPSFTPMNDIEEGDEEESIDEAKENKLPFEDISKEKVIPVKEQ